MSRRLRGVNIQRPWARLILEGLKTVEARTHEPKGYLNEDLWIIETAGKGRKRRSYIGVDGEVTTESAKGKDQRRKRRRSPTFVSRIIGIVKFGKSSPYTDLAGWRDDRASHRIPEGSFFDWQGPKSKKPKMYGWKVTSAQALVVPQQRPDKKGMIGCKAIKRVAVLQGTPLK